MSKIISRPNTRFKVSEKVTILLLVMVLVAVVNIGVIYTYHQQVEDAGNSVNVAGQQRMLTQRMVWYASDIAVGNDPDAARQRLRIAMERYDRNLDALRYGGRVTDTKLNPGGTNDGQPSVVLRGESLREPPAMAEDELAAEAAAWEEYRPHVRTVLNADPDSEAFAESYDEVRSGSDELLSLSDEATAELAAAIRVKRQALQRMLVVLLGVDVFVALLGSLFARRYLGTPMARMARKGLELADGNLEATHGENPPIDESIPVADQRSELARLNRAFDEVQEYLQTVVGQAEALADRDFDAPVLDRDVPGDLGTSLGTMRDDLQAYIHDLRTTTEKLDAIIAASPAAIYITDAQGIVQRWNPAASEIFGWDVEEVVGEPDPTVPPDRRDENRTLRSRVIAGESLSGVEGRRVTKSGTEIDVSLSTAAVRGPEGMDAIMTVAEDITERKERERILRRQHDELESLGRVMDLLLESTRELVETSTEERIESLVCERLAATDRYIDALIVEQVNDDEVNVRAASGGEEPEEVIVSPLGREAALQAADTVTVQVRESTRREGEDPGSDEDGPGQVAAIPLSNRENVHGVLLVGAESAVEFNERELAGMETLGKTVGFARNAITNKKLLFADSVVELRFSAGTDSFPLATTSDRLDCTVSLDGLVTTADAAVTLYLVVGETTGSEFVDRVTAETAVSDAWVVAEDENHTRVAVSLEAESHLGQLFQRAVTLTDVDIEDGAGEFAFEAPLSVEVGSVVEDVKRWYPGTDLIAKRERDRPVTTAADLATSMESELTDRQYEVFQTAYFGGYFEWPRDNTIEELAETLDIAGSTFHHHLRHAQRKLAAGLLDVDSEE